MAEFDFRHGIEVARRCPPELRIVGLLHDAIEDGTAKRSELASIAGLYALETLSYLTRVAGESYTEYIERVATDPAACLVKIADLEANLARMDEAHKSLRPRYEKALARLTRTAFSKLYVNPTTPDSK